MAPPHKRFFDKSRFLSARDLKPNLERVFIITVVHIDCIECRVPWFRRGPEIGRWILQHVYKVGVKNTYLSEEACSGKMASGSSTQLTAVGQLQILCAPSLDLPMNLANRLFLSFQNNTWDLRRRWDLQGSSEDLADPRHICNTSCHKKTLYFQQYLAFLYYGIKSASFFLWTISTGPYVSMSGIALLIFWLNTAPSLRQSHLNASYIKAFDTPAIVVSIYMCVFWSNLALQ